MGWGAMGSDTTGQWDQGGAVGSGVVWGGILSDEMGVDDLELK